MLSTLSIHNPISVCYFDHYSIRCTNSFTVVGEQPSNVAHATPTEIGLLLPPIATQLDFHLADEATKDGDTPLSCSLVSVRRYAIDEFSECVDGLVQRDRQREVEEAAAVGAQGEAGVDDSAEESEVESGADTSPSRHHSEDAGRVDEQRRLAERAAANERASRTLSQAGVADDSTVGRLPLLMPHLSTGLSAAQGRPFVSHWGVDVESDLLDYHAQSVPPLVPDDAGTFRPSFDTSDEATPPPLTLSVAPSTLRDSTIRCSAPLPLSPVLSDSILLPRKPTEDEPIWIHEQGVYECHDRVEPQRRTSLNQSSDGTHVYPLAWPHSSGGLLSALSGDVQFVGVAAPSSLAFSLTTVNGSQLPTQVRQGVVEARWIETVIRAGSPEHRELNEGAPAAAEAGRARAHSLLSLKPVDAPCVDVFYSHRTLDIGLWGWVRVTEWYGVSNCVAAPRGGSAAASLRYLDHRLPPGVTDIAVTDTLGILSASHTLSQSLLSIDGPVHRAVLRSPLSPGVAARYRVSFSLPTHLYLYTSLASYDSSTGGSDAAFVFSFLPTLSTPHRPCEKATLRLLLPAAATATSLAGLPHTAPGHLNATVSVIPPPSSPLVFPPTLARFVDTQQVIIEVRGAPPESQRLVTLTLTLASPWLSLGAHALLLGLTIPFALLMLIWCSVSLVERLPPSPIDFFASHALPNAATVGGADSSGGTNFREPVAATLIAASSLRRRSLSLSLLDSALSRFMASKRRPPLDGERARAAATATDASAMATKALGSLSSGDMRVFRALIPLEAMARQRVMVHTQWLDAVLRQQDAPSGRRQPTDPSFPSLFMLSLELAQARIEAGIYESLLFSVTHTVGVHDHVSRKK